MTKVNRGISLATFALSTLISLATYLISNEPFNLALVVLIILTCACLSWLPNLEGDYTRYERREMEPPINANQDENSWPGVIDQYNELNCEIVQPVKSTYSQQLLMDPCPQG